MPRPLADLRRVLQPVVGALVIRRWPWPSWRVRGWGRLPLGAHTFAFEQIASPAYAWWAHESLRRRWEVATIAQLTTVLRPGDLFFDVGAFVGAISLLASRLVGPEGRVVAFEPDPTTRAVLEANLRRNGVTNVTVAPYAVGRQTATARFDASGDSVSHLSERGAIEVEMVSLDEYCAEHALSPTVMKMDIEGGEADALSGSECVRGLRELMLEVHEPELRARGIDPQAWLPTLGPHRRLERATGGNYLVAVTPEHVPRASASNR